MSMFFSIFINFIVLFYVSFILFDFEVFDSTILDAFEQKWRAFKTRLYPLEPPGAPRELVEDPPGRQKEGKP